MDNFSLLRIVEGSRSQYAMPQTIDRPIGILIGYCPRRTREEGVLDNATVQGVLT